jgi:hypothetical protein
VTVLAHAGLAAAVLGALVLAVASPAGAHVVPQPDFITANESDTISIYAPNERKLPMTELYLRAPSGVEVVHAHAPAPWQASFTTSTATWTGGKLAPLTAASFGVVLDASRSPGKVQLQLEQRYDDGGVVRWPLVLTILPGNTSPSQNLGLATVVGIIGLLVVAAIGVLAWRRMQSAPGSE